MFWFVRHGETEPNRQGVRCGGDVDVPLNATGEAQIRALAPQLAGLQLGLIVTSPLQRTVASARLISEALGGLPIMIEPGFAERRLGQWNGCSLTETAAPLGRGDTPPGGESADAFFARVVGALHTLAPHLPHRLLLVSSKGVARVLGEYLGGGQQAGAGNGELIAFRFRLQGHGAS